MVEYPEYIVYNGEEYSVEYASTSEGEVKFIEVITLGGRVVAQTYWDEPTVTETDITDLMESNGFAPVIEGEDEEPLYTVEFESPSATEKKLDEIVKLLKKIEKNTRK